MAESLRYKTLKGTLWGAIERLSVQIITFIVMIVMANLLTPADYGLVGMLTIFIAISQSLVDSGFSQALIRKQNRAEIDYSTIFHFNLTIGLTLYIILFSIAPLIADFYKEPILCPLTRLISISIIINSFAIIQRALLTIKIDFKTQAIASLTAAIVSGGVGILLAFNGFGVWSIAWYQLCNVGVNSVMLWGLTRWKPKMAFSIGILKGLFGFGFKLTISGIINTLYNNILMVIIGKLFSAPDLGYYTRAHQFADFPSTAGTMILQKVTYPVLCSIQNNNEKLKNIYRRFLRLSAYVIFPVMLGLATLSEPFISVFLNDQWQFTAKLLPIVCYSMMWYPIHAINLNILQVKGESGIILKLEIIKKIVGTLFISGTLWFGLTALCWGMVANSLIALGINTYYTDKYVGIGFFTQIRDLLPTLIYSISMCIVVLGISKIFQNNLSQLCIGTIIGGMYYLVISKVTASKDLTELLSLIKTRH